MSWFSGAAPEGALKVFETTTNLGSTQLNTGGPPLALGYTGNVTVLGTAGFAASGKARTGEEIVEYEVVDATTLNITARGVWGTTDAAHNDTSVVGEVFASEILGTRGYSQLSAMVQADQDINMLIFWCSDAAASAIVKQEEPTFRASAQGSEWLSGGVYAPYVRWTAANVGGVDTTELFLSGDLASTALSGQLLDLETPVTSDMPGALTRSVITGDDPSGAYQSAGFTDKRELLTNAVSSSRCCMVTFSDPAVSSTRYALAIQTANASGSWPHTARAAIKIDVLDGDALFATGTAEASLRLGVITRIDGTDADVTWILTHRAGVQNANVSVELYHNYHPTPPHFEHDGSGGVYGVLSSEKSSGLTAINTGLALTSPAGTTVPSLGDVVAELGYVADTYSADVSLVYHSTSTWNGAG